MEAKTSSLPCFVCIQICVFVCVVQYDQTIIHCPGWKKVVYVCVCVSTRHHGMNRPTAICSGEYLAECTADNSSLLHDYHMLVRLWVQTWFRSSWWFTSHLIPSPLTRLCAVYSTLHINQTCLVFVLFFETRPFRSCDLFMMNDDEKFSSLVTDLSSFFFWSRFEGELWTPASL